MKKKIHTGSENRREMNLVERSNFEAHIRKMQRGIQRKSGRHRRWAGYHAGGDGAHGAAAKRRRRQIATGSLRVENGLIPSSPQGE